MNSVLGASGRQPDGFSMFYRRYVTAIKIASSGYRDEVFRRIKQTQK